MLPLTGSRYPGRQVSKPTKNPYATVRQSGSARGSGPFFPSWKMVVVATGTTISGPIRSQVLSPPVFTARSLWVPAHTSRNLSADFLSGVPTR